MNKADRPGADRLRNEIELMLGMRAGATMTNVPAHHGVDLSRDEPGARRCARPRARTMPSGGRRRCCATVAAKDEGIDELVDALDRHFRYLERSGTLRARRRARLRERVVDVVEDAVRRRLWTDADDRTPGSRRGCPSSRVGRRDAVRGRGRAAARAAPTCLTRTTT